MPYRSWDCYRSWSGVVFAYQGSDQLRDFGAELYTVNLLGIGFLRELGGLLAAIIVAGRSGSAFTAQIGTMKVSEELDAIQISGLNIIEVLVLPRLLGIIITLPLLTFYSNVMGMIGGATMCYLDLGITVPAFLHQLQTAVVGWTFWVGLIKAPVFAFVIALVGCHQGFEVERNASSVGRHTTQAVVEIHLPGHCRGCGVLNHLLMAGDMSESSGKAAVIRVRALLTRLGGRVLHDHLDLDVFRGEVLGRGRRLRFR